jgi:hypothetical protein
VSDNPYRGHRFPREIISECVWHYFRFGVSFRDVEEMMAARGVVVSYETIRRWCDKFGKQYADVFGDGVLEPETNGISTRSSSRSTAPLITSGERSIRTVLSSIFWFKRSGIALPQFGFSGSFYGQLGADRASLLQTSCGVTGQRSGS